MTSAEKELEEQILEAGNVLLQLPSPPAELLSHLDQVEKLLEKVDQSPSKSMFEALAPTVKALVEEELLRNENEDVRVAVACCISEITRITAPDAPYSDSLMKEVFQLIVSSFENLSDNSSHSYSKRTSILETVAKVRSCVVMLDLECDDLIIEMFQHFLKAIRDHHPEKVFSNMEIIMSLVLEESEDIGLDLISPILVILKKDNQEVQPIARKLAENVIGKCAEKIKPCLLKANSSTNFSFDDYSTIISMICMETNHIGHENHQSSGELMALEGMANGATSGVTTQGDENKLSVPSSDELPQGQDTKESIAETPEGEDHHAPVDPGSREDHSASIETDPVENHPMPIETGPGKDNPAPVETFPGEEHSVAVDSGPVEALPAPATSSKSATDNGAAETENEGISATPLTPEKPEHTNEEDRSHEDANGEGKAEPVDSDSGKVAKVEFKSAQVSKKRSRKPKHIIKSSIPSESSYTDADNDKIAQRKNDGDINLDKEFHASPSKSSSIKVVVRKDKKTETEQLSAPKALESEPENIFSPSPSGSALDEGRSRKDGRSKKNSRSSKNVSPSEDVTEKAIGGPVDSEVILRGKSGEKAPTSDSSAEKAQVPAKTSAAEGGSGSDSDAKVVKKSRTKADSKDHTKGRSSSKKKVDDKKRVCEKEAVSPPKPSKVVKGDSPLVGALKTSSKRKRTPSKEKEIDVKKFGKDLVGATIKVWWPMDKIFYEGVVDSFDPKTKKHKVTYTDGELEILNLGEEKWELTEDGEQETKAGSAETSLEMRKKKKAKSGSEPSATKGKTETSRDGDASFSRSKGAATKSSRKSVDDSKDDGKLKEVTPKSTAKSEDVKGKSKVLSKKTGGKSSVDASEKAANSDDEDSGTLKSLVNFKLGSHKTATKDKSKTATNDKSKSATKDKSKTATKDSPKIVAKDAIKSGSKSNTPKSGSKSSQNGAGKVKSGSAKSKETKEKEKSPEMAKASKSGKVKSAETSKGKTTEEKSGKKKKRN